EDAAPEPHESLSRRNHRDLTRRRLLATRGHDLWRGLVRQTCGPLCRALELPTEAGLQVLSHGRGDLGRCRARASNPPAPVQVGTGRWAFRSLKKQWGTALSWKPAA